LINELIEGTIHQQRLVEWKKQGINQQPNDLKKVGSAYWYAFLHRHANCVCTKKGRKFELDRSNWTKYRNFLSMYEDIEEELVDAGLGVKLPPPPIWMDEKGNQVEEHLSVGMKVQTRLLRPDMCIVMDEVGCNINMTKDGHVNWTQFVVDKNDEAKQKASKKEKYFTCLGLTLLTGNPIMCVVIIDGKNDDLLVRTGVDMDCKTYYEKNTEEGEDDDTFIKNMGKGLQYLCGPTCCYDGIEIPCMVAFNPGGGMTAPILTDIFRTLDKLAIFTHKNGIRPFVLLDGHSTRFGLEFLEYINKTEHRWSVCIGVPYGTSLWQVGDSVHQNGQFKVKITKKKNKFLKQEP
jgi:hypothetical protein